MIALDTNMLVRALVADDPAQAAVVQKLIIGNTIFLSRTVLLETEWVLRARYGRTRDELLPFFRALLETEDTIVEAADEVRCAVDWYAEGADFADAMHLAACGSAVLHTFDRNFCVASRTGGTAPEVHVHSL